MTQTVIAWTNLVKLATVTATNYEAALPPENTLNDIGAPSTGWQTEYGTTNATLTYTLADEASTVRVIALFRTNLTAAAQITATITYDNSETWTETLAGPAAGYGQVIFVLTDAKYADSIAIEIDDPENPDGFLNVPMVFIGDAWLPGYSIAPSFADTWEPQQNIQRSRGGQRYITQLANERTATFEFGAVLSADAYAAPRELARLSGLGVNVLFIPDGDGDEVKYDAIFGTIVARPMGTTGGAGRLRTWGATITERL